MTTEPEVDWVANWATRFQPAEIDGADGCGRTTAQPAGPSYRRAVSPLEWVFLGIEPERTVVNFVVEGQGRVTAEELSRAVAVASEVNPGARLVRRDNEWRDSGRAPEVRVPDGPFDLDSPDLRAGLADDGPTCEVLVVPGETSTTMVFRAAHTVMDGKGVLLWASDVFRVLRADDPIGAASPMNGYELLQRICAPDEPPSASEPPAMRYPSPIGPRASETAGPLWRRRSVDGTHPAATAKVVAALAAAYGGGLFAIPVDLRRHVPDLRSTAMLSQPVQLTATEVMGWEQVQRDLLMALAAGQELGSGVDPGIMGLPLPVLRMGFADLDRQAAEKDTYTGRAVISHLGAVDLAELSTMEFAATACYPLGGTNPGSPPELNLVEMAGRTEITLAWYDGPGVAERADALLDVVAEALSPAAHRDWTGNRTERALPSPDSVVRLFRDQAARTPDRIAVIDQEEGEVRYAELSSRADAVVADLRGRGIGPGSVVGLLAGRTVAAVAGLWGVLRTGACYLPLDARHPDLRVAGLLADAGSEYCLVERAQWDRSCLPAGCTALPLDDLAAPGATAPAADADIDPTSLAYVIYTSGSTGRPKGVQVEHGNLRNYAHWGIREFGLDEDIRLPLLTALSFDLSVTALFLPLLVGGTLVLLKDEPNHVSLRWLIGESGANSLTLTPSHLDLIGRLDLKPSGFRSLIVVGEQLRTSVAQHAAEMFGPGCRLINMYGPTEATVGCTSHTFDSVADANSAAVPIGTPGDNTSVFLLDEQRRFVSPGEIGEMYLGGAQVARGYLGSPELDRERFPRLADGTRVYRTGDLARLLPTGELEFAGRVDDQVKIRGYRVEPAEAAGALDEHPAVDRAVVIARTSEDGAGKALYGYVVANASVTGAELVEHLAARLPGYLVPAAVVVLPEFPYTVNGKIDVSALPNPFSTDRTTVIDPDSLDEVAAAVARVWSRTLGVPLSELDGQANFHRLGGDSLSLLAMLAGVSEEVLIASAENAFMAQLPRILRDPTLDHVAGLARELGTVDAERGHGGAARPIYPGPRPRLGEQCHRA